MKRAKQNQRYLRTAILVAIIGGAIFWYRKVHAGSFDAQVGKSNLAAFDIALLIAVASVFSWWFESLIGRARNGVSCSPNSLILNQTKDYLARIVEHEWVIQLKQRRVTAPTPVRIGWRFGPSDLISRNLQASITRGDFFDSSIGPIKDPVLDITKLFDALYSRLPLGRPLVILGDVEQGKSGAMALLLIATLEARSKLDPENRARIPVPVWLSLNEWSPQSVKLSSWVLRTMKRDYPGLLTNERGGEEAVHELISFGHVALFLDGLDEMPRDMRVEALKQLNDHSSTSRIVVTSRTLEYKRASKRSRLDGVVPVQLQPVGIKDAIHYLESEEGLAQTSWGEFCSLLQRQPNSVVALTLTTPLTLTLVRDTYYGGMPSELFDRARFESEASLKTHLMRRLIHNSYSTEREQRAATRRLAWVAHNLGKERNIRWWDAACWINQRSLSRISRYSSAFLVSIGAVASIAVVSSSLKVALTMTVAILIGFLGNPGKRTVTAVDRQADYLSIRIPGRSVLTVLFTNAALGGMLAMLVSHFSPLPPWGSKVSLWEAYTFGFSVFFLTGLNRFWNHPYFDDPAATPASTYRGEKLVSLFRVIGSGYAIGGTLYILGFGLIISISIGVALVLGFWIEYSLISAVWIADFRFRGLRLREPSFMKFMEDANRKQIIRQVGAAYQFRHLALQTYMASLFQKT